MGRLGFWGTGDAGMGIDPIERADGVGGIEAFAVIGASQTHVGFDIATAGGAF